jgi:hypothetical protein
VVVIVWELDLQLPVQAVPVITSCEFKSRSGEVYLIQHYVIKFVSDFTTKVVSWNPTHGEVYSIQQYVIKFVNDLQQVGGFLRVLRCPPPIKIDCHNIAEILLKVALNTITLTLLQKATMRKSRID